MPVEEIDYRAAGINHMAFYLRFERDGEDLYPRLERIVEDGRVPDANRVRYEVLRHLGYFVTESSEHFAEYVPWFIKAGRPDLVERFNIPIDEYLRRGAAQAADWARCASGSRATPPRSASSAAPSTAPTSCTPARRASPSPSTGTSPTPPTAAH